jgi:glucose/mannose-6-phosphate isomerase
VSPILDRATVAAADPTAQAADILALPDHLRDALHRVGSAALRPFDSAGVLVSGMGGSAIGARLAVAALGDRLRLPVLLAPAYAPPAGLGAGWLAYCASYSGGTEETLAAFGAAGERGAHRIVATAGGELAERARSEGVPVIPLPGGFQPRATVGYSLVSALAALAAGGAGPAVEAEVEAAADLAEALVAEWGPDGPEDGLAKSLARRLVGTVPVIYGAELTAAVAYRWKTQLNENAKVPAFAAELPEADHNEIVGWPAAGGLGHFSAVFLEDPDGDPRVAARVALTAEIVADGAEAVERVSAPGETALERLVALVLLGDLVSLYLAVLRGEDPATIEPIVRLKAALAAGPAA